MIMANQITKETPHNHSHHHNNRIREIGSHQDRIPLEEVEEDLETLKPSFMNKFNL